MTSPTTKPPHLPTSSASHALIEYFRCPVSLPAFEIGGQLSDREGYFRYGDTILYGRCAGASPIPEAADRLPDVSSQVNVRNDRIALPFDLSQVVANLREERYQQVSQNMLGRVTTSAAARGVYYLFRPILSVAVRKHLQRIRLRGWDRIAFPRWPVDGTVETLMRASMGLALESRGRQSIPFIWFWPDGSPSACIITHDVEGLAGQAFSPTLMDIDDSFGFKSAFQVVPEVRSEAPGDFIKEIRRRGFEGNVHDLNHDGYLFHNRQQFDERAAKINQYARKFGSRGFRAGAMHRVEDWFDALDVSFDMSVPNVAHLEPQRGGCCTVMPYFIGRIVELPLTTTQDYSLFHILNDYSIALWKKQIDLILANNGLITILSHPDYLIDERARAVYSELLANMRGLCDDRHVWSTLPGEVDRWWRSRSQMTLVPHGDSWRIEGPESHRARIAYATIKNGNVVYKLHCAH